MPALQERNQSERTHNIVPNGGKCAKAYRAGRGTIFRIQTQPESFSSEAVFGGPYGKAPSAFIKTIVRQLDAPGAFLRNQLNGAGAFPFCCMDSRDDRYGLLVGLTFKIPSAEIITHGRDLLLCSLISVLCRLLTKLSGKGGGSVFFCP